MAYAAARRVIPDNALPGRNKTILIVGILHGVTTWRIHLSCEQRKWYAKLVETVNAVTKAVLRIIVMVMAFITSRRHKGARVLNIRATNNLQLTEIFAETFKK